MHIEDLKKVLAAASVSTTGLEGTDAHVAGPVSSRASASHCRWRTTAFEGGSPWLKLPVSLDALHASGSGHIRAHMPPGGWQDESRQSRRTTGENALLLLRPAMRDSIEGPRKPGDRVRAVGRISLQSKASFAQRASSAICRAVTQTVCWIR